MEDYNVGGALESLMRDVNVLKDDLAARVEEQQPLVARHPGGKAAGLVFTHGLNRKLLEITGWGQGLTYEDLATTLQRDLEFAQERVNSESDYPGDLIFAAGCKQATRYFITKLTEILNRHGISLVRDLGAEQRRERVEDAAFLERFTLSLREQGRSEAEIKSILADIQLKA